MKWENVKIGTVVRIKGEGNYIGYIFKIDEDTKEVKVNWSSHLAEWKSYDEFEKIEINCIDFLKNLYEINK